MVCGLFLHFKQILILAAGGRELWRGETEPARVYCGPNAGQEGQPQIAGVILNLPRVLEFWQLSAKGPGWTSQKTKGRRLFRDVLVPLFLSWKADLDFLQWGGSTPTTRIALENVFSTPDGLQILYLWLPPWTHFLKHPEPPNGIHDFTWYILYIDNNNHRNVSNYQLS